jgi:predicted MFS family arabinose efflux permease
VYGIYSAATEGIIKAWITNLVRKEDTATAIGFYTSCESICTLLASIIAGALWAGVGSVATFISTSAIAIIVCFYFLLKIRDKKIAN